MIAPVTGTDIGLMLSSGIWFVLFCVSAYLSWRENEKRAGVIFLLLALVLPAVHAIALLLVPALFKWIFLVVPWLFLLILVLPVKGISEERLSHPNNRIDERDTMLSRRLLKPEDPEYRDYYSKHPDKKNIDDAIRAKPGFLSPQSQLYHTYSFSAAQASFETIQGLVGGIDGPVHEVRIQVSPEQVTRFIRYWILKMGGQDMGVTPLRAYHLYSFRGRRHNYGANVENDHHYAVAFTVEMDKEMMDTAPKGPTIMESARKYLDAATMAIQIAQFIRQLGYPARAHIDGNYEVVCPLVARDAGLGDIGRMGLLMTPALGPRVRIGVVTTSLELLTDPVQPDPAMIDFCSRCKKCAEVCPSQAISFQDRKLTDGVLRWQIDQERCYDYWCTSGTDCGRCMAVCPYSHPDNFLHNLVRIGIRNSFLFRRLALPLDHLFYGRKPRSKPIPEWMENKMQNSGI